MKINTRKIEKQSNNDELMSKPRLLKRNYFVFSQ
ncbi:YokU family protein [Peribacillus butanolivorans]|uniref:Uncharacterized protein n=1 Tax=Peribacillus butanolivorans TaxID=421767 RepID=A0ABM6XIN2_9BACI|nr:YokU family protein [Peribacillus butanolivorans]AXN38101.1 hypothetical protein DTO10_06425 [Peribacillus butanolivorans]MCO0597813.1 YokU family protein [Peribacillus butanolivorans]